MIPYRIICYKWGTKFPASYVNTLYNMVKSNTTKTFTFHCFTDDPSDLLPEINHHPLLSDPNKLGWWTKIDTFRPDIQNIVGEGVGLLLDLDLVIVDNIDPILELGSEDDFVVFRDVDRRNGFNTSVVRFKIGRADDIFTNLNLNKMDHAIYKHKGFGQKKYWGDQAWVTECRKDHDDTRVMPSHWIQSYKAQCLKRGSNSFKIPYSDTKIVLFHGDPMPHERLDHIGRYWK